MSRAYAFHFEKARIFAGKKRARDAFRSAPRCSPNRRKKRPSSPATAEVNRGILTTDYTDSTDEGGSWKLWKNAQGKSGSFYRGIAFPATFLPCECRKTSAELS